MSTLPKLIVILGPTASGKSEMAQALAKKYNGYIISADSRALYKGFDIGTAKPKFDSQRELSRSSSAYDDQQTPFFIKDGIYHCMIDITTPDREYTLAQYQQEVYRILKHYRFSELESKTPFLVGGTGLYITSIVDNLRIPKIAPNPDLRQEIENEIAQNGLNFVFQRLLRLDPDAEHKVDANNPRRVIRALEICLSTGKAFTKQQNKGQPQVQALQIGIKRDRDEIYQRIEQRVDAMLSSGLENEVRNLISKYDWRLPAFSGIGYRQLISHFQGNLDRDKTISLIKRDTKRYVRRQLTWWRRDPRIQWIQNSNEADDLIQKFI